MTKFSLPRTTKATNLNAMPGILRTLFFLLLLMNSAHSQEDRVAVARQNSNGRIRQWFADAGVAYPPGGLFLRAFKHEGILEVWASGPPGKPLKMVHAFEILTPSGKSGPKRREGDLQVPEGAYEIDRFNPKSLFHLSLGLNYPNASDRILSDPTRPGGDIFIHGGDLTIGCMPLGDSEVEALYVIALDHAAKSRGQIPIHVFPCRMNEAGWRAILGPVVLQEPALGPFWNGLQPLYDAFEKSGKVPAVSVNPDGTYKVNAVK